MQASSDPFGHSVRGFLAITYSVLSVCLNGALKTEVMFRANLNSKQLRFYLASLERRGLVEEVRVPPSAKVHIRTTVKGRGYIDSYESAVQLLSGPELLERALFA